MDENLLSQLIEAVHRHFQRFCEANARDYREKFDFSYELEKLLGEMRECFKKAEPFRGKGSLLYGEELIRSVFDGLNDILLDMPLSAADGVLQELEEKMNEDCVVYFAEALQEGTISFGMLDDSAGEAPGVNE